MMIRYLLTFTAVCCAMGFSFQGEAKANPFQSHHMGDELRRTGADMNELEVIKLAQREKWAQASALSASIKDPTTKLLVDWYYLRSDYPHKDFMPLANFIEKYRDWPKINTIRAKAEKLMPAEYSDNYVVQWFSKHEPITVEGMERYAKALKATGQTVVLKAALEKWLPTAMISPNEQARVLQSYNQYISKETLISRFHSTLIRDQYSNAREVAARLGNGYPALAEARIALSAKGKGVDDLIARVPATLKNDIGLALERIIWRRRSENLDGAVSLMQSITQKTNDADTLSLMWKERHILIRSLLEKKRYKEAYELAVAHQQKEGLDFAQAQWMAGWLALRYMNKPMEAFHRFDSLYKNVSTPISKSRGAYWAARASEALGDTKTAQVWYEAAGRYPTVFYGQMALDKLGKKANYVGSPETGANLDQAQSNPKVRAVYLLHKAGLQNDAESFLYALIDDAETGKINFSALSQLALETGAPNLSVHIAKKAENKGHILMQYAFPNITNVTQGLSFDDHALIHGLIRQESAFDKGAQSHSGALGLMQLMPATANETARKMGLPYSKAKLTQDPLYNIKLGSAYISQMLDRFGGSYPLAIAAYNGGPGRVSGWTKTMGHPGNLKHEELLDWIESIPVYETRNYVQRVTEAMRVYADVFYASGYNKNMQVAWNQIP